jgi:hypothetical protein
MNSVYKAEVLPQYEVADRPSNIPSGLQQHVTEDKKNKTDWQNQLQCKCSNAGKELIKLESQLRTTQNTP